MKKQLVGLTVACALATPAYALIEGDVDPDTSASPFAGVGAFVTSSGLFSGMLIGDGYVLTAAHVVNGRSIDSLSFKVNDGSGLSYSAAEVFVFDGYNGTKAGSDGVWHDDLAVVRLAEPVSGVPFYDLYSGALKVSSLLSKGSQLTFVGYGVGGDGVNGATIAANSSVKRVGSNIVDKLYGDDDGGSFDEVFRYTFDKNGLPDEAHLGGGDSGGAAFINDNGVWKIAGILTFVGSSDGKNLDKYGAFGGGTIVAPYIDWINSVMYPVPEPETYAMMLAGLGLVGFAARRRAKA